MSLQPTLEQEKIILEPSNIVVIAKPGSGKTFTLSKKIKCILPELPYYKGVIAISFTNKASDELERRCLSSGVDAKSSFFGTLDSFYLAEIIFPFGIHLFGMPENELNVITLKELRDNDPEFLKSFSKDQGITDAIISEIQNIYLDGNIILETIGPLAIYVYDHSFSCRRYIRAKYTHVFVDEYQDCDKYQHDFFIRLVNLGLKGIAVGDTDQSIFAFANKDSRFLFELASGSKQFTTFPLSKNHRCHPSIINYSTGLLSGSFEPIPTDDIRVFRKYVEGSEIEIANWLTTAVSRFSDRYAVSEMNKIGVLVKNSQTGNILHRNLGIPHKAFATTPLDSDSSLWGRLFRRIFFWVFNLDITKYEFVENYLSIDFQKPIVKRVMALLNNLENVANQNPNNLQDADWMFQSIAKLIYPNRFNQNAIEKLSQVLRSNIYLSSFIPANIGEVQLMTLHKAKGLEFDLVFHLNLYRWILPQYNGDYDQDKNLHYVGITRAKKCCVLCTSSQRHNYHREITEAEESDFLYTNDLESYRLNSPF
jgi:superfamily I DNA/RNA helicase